MGTQCESLPDALAFVESISVNTSKIMDIINEVEDRFSVEKWISGGIHIWPYLRMKLNFDICRVYHTNKHRRKAFAHTRSTKFLGDITRFGIASLVDRHKNARPFSHVDAVLVSDGLSYAKLEGYWYEKFCDPLIEWLSNQSLSTFMISPLNEYRTPRYSPSLFIQPFLDVAKIRGRVASSQILVNDVLAVEYPLFIEYLNRQKLINYMPDIKDLRRQAMTLQGMADVFSRYLRELSPKLVFGVCYYGMEGMALNLACRKMGIPSIDLQHGVQGDLHVAYGRWNRVPSEGYELLPSRFWVWSESEVATIERWNSSVARWHKPLLGGNLWMNEWRWGHNELIERHDKRIQYIKKQIPGMSHVLITLQSGLADEQVLGPILKVMSSRQRDIFWWVRLHPCMLKEKATINRMIESNQISFYDLDVATDFPLYALLRHMDLHVTHSSSTVIEAEYFDIPSVIISAYGAEFFADQIFSGVAVAAVAKHEIEDAFDRLLKNRNKSMSKHARLDVTPAFEELLKMIRKNEETINERTFS